MHIAKVMLLLALSTVAAVVQAETPPPATPATATPTYDAALAKRLGADERGMRSYVLVILKTGPTPVPEEVEGERRRAGGSRAGFFYPTDRTEPPAPGSG